MACQLVCVQISTTRWSLEIRASCSISLSVAACPINTLSAAQTLVVMVLFPDGIFVVVLPILEEEADVVDTYFSIPLIFIWSVKFLGFAVSSMQFQSFITLNGQFCSLSNEEYVSFLSLLRLSTRLQLSFSSCY